MSQPRYANAPYHEGRGWTRHWLLKAGRALAFVDTHPAHGVDALKVSNLYVIPEHRGHDYGRTLVKSAMSQFPDRDFVITPNPWKDKAVPRERLAQLYGTLGFEKMAGERYKDLMIFRRPFAFKMGVLAAREQIGHSCD